MDAGTQSIFSSPTMDRSRLLFQELKTVCMPLRFLGKLDSRTTRTTIEQLGQIISCLRAAYRDGVEMRPDLLSFVLVHMTQILGANEPERIADQVMERILIVMDELFQHWWWTCELALWDQIFVLAGTTIGGPVGGNGKTKERDDETKEAAVRLLITLTRNRATDEFPDDDDKTPELAQERFNRFIGHAGEPKLVPIIGKTLDSLVITASSEHMPLQQASLQLLEVILSDYMPQDVTPTVLPGVVSMAVRIVLGQAKDKRTGKGWVNGNVVRNALAVLRVAAVKAMGDDVCLAAGIVREANTLEDIFELNSEAVDGSTPSVPRNIDKPYITQRTTSWLRATSSQVLVALNSLTPLVRHPSPVAQQGLVDMSATILSQMRLTLPEARPLLLSFLLTLSTAYFDEVARHSRTSLLSLLAPPSKARHDLLQAMLQATADNLSALPRLLLSRADSKIEFVSAQVEAVSTLPFVDGDNDDRNTFSAKSATSSIRSGVGKLLGPLGHVEKWGWSLLNVLLFSPPPITVSHPFTFGAQLSLEGSLDFADHIVFPEVTLQHITSRSTHAALERMLRALGRAGGDECLFAVEWFVSVGTRGYGRDSGSAAALWVACRLLEGVSRTPLQLDEKEYSDESRNLRTHGKRVERFARWLAKHISELWNMRDDNLEDDPKDAKTEDEKLAEDDSLPLVEFSKGLTPLKTELNFKAKPKPADSNPDHSYALHKSFSLQLLCVSAAILRSRFANLLMHTVYPLLRSFVSESHHLATTALSSLQFITNCTGYASPSNLLLSNFDYALDAVSRRLTRGWLDVEATKVLVVLVRLVGRDVVQRAGDVVEECFDRLDDFHGYSTIVEGVIEALLEVVKIVEMEGPAKRSEMYSAPVDEESQIRDCQRLELLFDWIERRREEREEESKEARVPHPREAWGKGKGKEPDAEDEDDSYQETQREGDDPFADPPLTPTQALTRQIVIRSLYFLTHGSPPIRVRILALLSSSVPVLTESALLPSIHKAWPFILNRLGDSETYVVSAAAGLVEALATNVGSFMTARIWDDIWPRFRKMLQSLDEADRTSALARRNAFNSYAGTESAYTHSHRLYRSMLRTMTAAAKGGVQIHDAKTWEVLVSFRRFLQREAHEELQRYAVELYIAFGVNNEDTVWLILQSTIGPSDARHDGMFLQHLRESRWDIRNNLEAIFSRLSQIE